MFNTLLIADSLAKGASDAAGNPQHSMDVIEVMMTGGVVMIILILALLLAVYFIIERIVYINGRSKLDFNLLNVVKDNIKSDNPQGALTYCERTPTAQAQTIATGLRFLGSNMREIESAMETRGQVEISAMESNLNYLALISRIAPMLGFVGTIIGVINIFYRISLDSNLSIGNISEGLYQKMVTSVGGLIVGMIAFIGYQLLIRKVDKYSEKLQEQSLGFLEMLNKSGI